MAKVDDLKKMIADVLKVSTTDIDNGYSLKSGKLKSSAGRVILGNMVRKVFGRKVDTNVETFEELMAKIEGDESSVESETMNEFSLSGEETEEPVPAPSITGKPVCGIDIQEIDIFPEVEDYWAESFYTDNFTKNEIAYCVTAASPRHSFAGRWCVKEALHKCGSKYYNIPLRDIQVVKQKCGTLSIEICGDNGEWIELSLSCSLSHADNYAVGMVTGFDGR